MSDLKILRHPNGYFEYQRPRRKLFGGHGGGVILWDYGSSKLTPFGLINLGYAPLWLLVSFAFDPISDTLRSIVNYLAKVQ